MRLTALMTVVLALGGCGAPSGPSVTATTDHPSQSVYGTWKATLTRAAVDTALTDAGLGDRVDQVWGDVVSATGETDAADLYLYISREPHVGTVDRNWHLLTTPDCRDKRCTMDGNSAAFSDDKVLLTRQDIPGVVTLQYQVADDTLRFAFDSSTRRPSEEEYLRGLYAAAQWTRTDAPAD